MNKVSVIVPNYNRANVIGATIDALLNQTLKPYEIIVVDDGSSDNSMNVLDSYGNQIKVVRQENKGPGAARNLGIKMASGELIQLMDSDDIPSLNKLEVQAKALMQHQADLVIGPWVRGWFKDNFFQPENVALQTQALPEKRTVLDCFLTDWSMVFQQTLVRKDVLLRAGVYDEEMRIMEDGDLFVRLLLNKVKVVFEQDSLTLYRLGDNDKLTTKATSDLQKLKDHLVFYKKLFGYSENLKVYMDNKFQLKLFGLNNELKRYGINDHIINDHINISETKYKFLAIEKRVREGLQQRIKGHRWSKAYQTSKLTKKHIKMINELGYILKG